MIWKDAPVDYLCGGLCKASPGIDFWYEDNENSIGYKPNVLLDDIPEGAGSLKIR